MTLSLLSYKKERSVVFDKDGIEWHSKSIYGWRSTGYIGAINLLIRKNRPDWIIGVSDTYYGILAAYFGRKFGIPFAVDAYDNYESYLPWCKPLHFLWRRAIKKANVVTAAGPQLARYMNRFRPRDQVHVVPMAADPSGFKPLDKKKCREEMNLPGDNILIGYCGSISNDRGIKSVFQAYEQIQRENSNARLLLAGRLQKKMRLPQNTIYLGYISDDKVPVLMNAMDVLLVPNQLSKFGNYSYPVKLYEAMSCRIPVVATATAPAKWILNDRKQFLAGPADANAMAQKIIAASAMSRPCYDELNTWENSCDIFEKLLLEHA
jgi:glycosyltransferase involved in cell wall biosynthesis